MLAQFTVIPLDYGQSMGDVVAHVIDLIDRSGLPYQLTAMGTLVEGDTDEVFELIKNCHNLMKQYSNRVSTHVAIDDRKDAVGRLSGKVERIAQVLQRPVRT